MELFLAALAGLVIAGISYISKWTSIPTKYVVVVVACLLGALYAGFQQFAPVELQDSVVAFVGVAASSSWVIWEFIVKPRAEQTGAFPN